MPAQPWGRHAVLRVVVGPFPHAGTSTRRWDTRQTRRIKEQTQAFYSCAACGSLESHANIRATGAGPTAATPSARQPPTAMALSHRLVASTRQLCSQGTVVATTCHTLMCTCVMSAWGNKKHGLSVCKKQGEGFVRDPSTLNSETCQYKTCLGVELGAVWRSYSPSPPRRPCQQWTTAQVCVSSAASTGNPT